MIDYSNKNALIIGLARSGLSAAKLLDRMGSKTVITDIKSYSDLKTLADQLPDSVEQRLGSHNGLNYSEINLGVISPGVPWDSPIAESVRSANIELISEVELAFSLLEAPVIAVTGSNGKSTTTSMIGSILKSVGKKVYVGGNIGAPLCDAVGGDYDWIVAEISSFQLEAVKTFRPKIAILLNITPDHLDRHKDMETYASLKARLFENQSSGDCAILNAQDEIVMNIALPDDIKTCYFSRDEMRKPGAWTELDKAYIQTDTTMEELFNVDELKIKGAHNIENALAASLVGYLAGGTIDQIKSAVTKFTGLHHRMELVSVIDNVSYYNDSKATNIDAAVKSLYAFNKNVVLIAGGSDKGANFNSLADAIARNAKGVVLMGETAPKIEQALGSFENQVKASTMGEAVELATRWTKPGDAVLLAPACASFDMYDSFEQRGQAFIDAVVELEKVKK